MVVASKTTICPHLCAVVRIPKLALLLLLAVLPLGVLLSCGGGARDEAPEGLETIGEIIDILQEEFVEKDRLSTDELVEAAIRGVIAAIDDPYASYVPPAQASIAFNFTGAFEGIGAEVTALDGQIIIQTPLPGSPALRAGIAPGDVVLAVDGESIEGLTLVEAVLLIRGPKGSEVVLTVLRPGRPTPLDVSIIRDTIQLQSVSSRILEPGIGYVGIATFDLPTVQALRDAIASLRAEGARGLILDLRGNPGGLVDTAVAVASEFLTDGLVFVAIDGDGDRTEYPVQEGGTATDIPMVVLVDGISASASEIITGALQDAGRATVIGARTFGKGSVNVLTELRNNARLVVTSARWFTRGGRAIEGEGLEPDITVGNTASFEAVALLSRRLQQLCDAFEEAGAGLAGAPELESLLDQLCNIGPSAPPDDQEDEVLRVAIDTLKTNLR